MTNAHASRRGCRRKDGAGDGMRLDILILIAVELSSKGGVVWEGYGGDVCDGVRDGGALGGVQWDAQAPRSDP